MSITPKITLVAYEERVGGFVFVAVPNERGRYVRTDKSVVLTDCPICRAIAGEPCKSNSSTQDGYGSGTHAVRRERAKPKFYGVRGEDQIEPASITGLGYSPVEKLLGSIDLCEPRAIA